MIAPLTFFIGFVLLLSGVEGGSYLQSLAGVSFMFLAVMAERES